MNLGDLVSAGLKRSFERMRDGKAEDSKCSCKILITSLADWAAAFTVYAAILTRAKPDKACQLFGYMSIIFRMAWEGRDKAWLQYDELFCQAIAVDLNLLWGKRDLELWMTTTTPTDEEDPPTDVGSSHGPSSREQHGSGSSGPNPDTCCLWN